MINVTFKELRMRMGVSQKKIAEWLDTSLSTIYRYEREGAPRVAMLALCGLILASASPRPGDAPTNDAE